MSVPDSEVVTSLTANGAAVTDYFLIEAQVCSLNAHGELMALTIDDPDLAGATVSYLRRIGATEYPSLQAYLNRS